MNTSFDAKINYNLKLYIYHYSKRVIMHEQPTYCNTGLFSTVHSPTFEVSSLMAIL